jgi:hypothetical protein
MQYDPFVALQRPLFPLSVVWSSSEAHTATVSPLQALRHVVASA